MSGDLKIQAACTRTGCSMFAGGICTTCGMEVPAGYGEPSDDLKERLDTLAKQTGEASLFDALARIAELETQLKTAREALDSSQSLLAMIYHIGTEINGKYIPAIDWENEDLSKLLAEQITENRAALDPKPTATGDDHG